MNSKSLLCLFLIFIAFFFGAIKADDPAFCYFGSKTNICRNSRLSKACPKVCDDDR